MVSSEKIKIGILTSSRADYGIYQPLLRQLQTDNAFDMYVIAFGMHLLDKFGHTVDSIYQEGYRVSEVENIMCQGDSPSDLVQGMAATMKSFSDFFSNNKYNLLFALGDRYEMFAAVAASVPFNTPVAHIHGGETTLGAIDNAFRHSITCFSRIHFASTKIYQERIIEITGGRDHVYNVGALSIDNLKQTRLLEVKEFNERYNIDLAEPTILFTFHPETVDYERNKDYIIEIVKVFTRLSHYQILVTMPNADTMGLFIRNELMKAKANLPNIIIVESFGSLGYLSAMKNCSFMLGNTSSGFVEASYFSKPVINLGERQKGRIITPNIMTIPVQKEAIIEAVSAVEKMDPIKVNSIYGSGDSAVRIVNIVKKEFNLN